MRHVRGAGSGRQHGACGGCGMCGVRAAAGSTVHATGTAAIEQSACPAPHLLGIVPHGCYELSEVQVLRGKGIAGRTAPVGPWVGLVCWQAVFGWVDAAVPSMSLPNKSQTSGQQNKHHKHFPQVTQPTVTSPCTCPPTFL